MNSKAKILEDFALFSLPGGGIGGWLTDKTDPLVFERLAKIDADPLSKVQLDQLLLLAEEAGVTEDFFQYYWLECPSAHAYDCRTVPGFDGKWLDGTGRIRSLGHLKWGLYRLYV